MSTTQRNTCGEKTTNGKGVVYYKLSPGYVGDETKNCGLVGNEIDNNFFFLRGYDIESASYNEETSELILVRVNGEEIKVDLSLIDGGANGTTFEYDSINGTLVITYPNGDITNVSGFTVNGVTEISTDSTLLGNGTVSNPLRVNPIEATGTFAPADYFIDLTDEESEFPETGKKGERIVTKEYVNQFGKLYNFDSVEKIDAKLEEEGNGWRVPTKEDFDELLNALECEEDKNHNSNALDFLGKVAGQALKSKEYWNQVEGNITTDDTNGLDTVGMRIYPTGNGGKNETTADEFGVDACIWTSTKDRQDTAYIKIFHYDSNKVEQDTDNIGDFNSIRLVKDYNLNNYSEIEDILNLPYPTVLIRIPESNYIKIWTSTNFYHEDDELEYIEVNFGGSGLEDLTEVYYANEWDGTKWVKKQLQEGDSIVILNKDGIEYREWRLKHGELYDIFGEDFNDELASIQQDIQELSSSTVSLSASVVNNFSTINQTIANNYEELYGKIDELSANTKTFENGLEDVDNHVSIKIDETNDEGYLKVDENGLKTEGINAAIEEAKTEVIETISESISEMVSGVSQDMRKYEINSNDIVVATAETGTTLSLNLGPTLKKVYNTTQIDAALRIKKDGDNYYLADGNGNRLPDSDDIFYNDKGTVKQIRPGRDNSDIENGTINEGTDTGVPALCILYKDNDGNYQLSKTSLNDLLNDKYAGPGIEIKSLTDNGYTKVMTKLHTGQEYLGVDENGLYVTGITEGFNNVYEYIDSKIESAMTVIRQEISAYTENMINNFADSLEENVQNIVKNYISGTPYEIDVKEIQNRLVIGFTKDALFGADMND